MYRRRTVELENVLRSRGIKYLVHCTPLINLSSILSHGILPVADIAKSEEVHGVNTDPQRRDGNLDASCFSVTEPNFEHLKRNSAHREQAIIFLSAELILEKSCAFYPSNAANKSFRYKSLSHWKWSGRFDEMVSGNPNSKNSDGAFYPSNLTTNSNAEIHVFGVIDPNWIELVSISSKHNRKHYQLVYPEIAFIDYFEAR